MIPSCGVDAVQVSKVGKLGINSLNACIVENWRGIEAFGSNLSEANLTKKVLGSG